jgi:hypothetical protein
MAHVCPACVRSLCTAAYVLPAGGIYASTGYVFLTRQQATSCGLAQQGLCINSCHVVCPCCVFGMHAASVEKAVVPCRMYVCMLVHPVWGGGMCFVYSKGREETRS